MKLSKVTLLFDYLCLTFASICSKYRLYDESCHSYGYKYFLHVYNNPAEDKYINFFIMLKFACDMHMKFDLSKTLFVNINITSFFGIIIVFKFSRDNNYNYL